MEDLKEFITKLTGCPFLHLQLRDGVLTPVCDHYDVAKKEGEPIVISSLLVCLMCKQTIDGPRYEKVGFHSNIIPSRGGSFGGIPLA